MKRLLAFLVLVLACQAVTAAEIFGTVDALSGSATVSDASGKPQSLAVGQRVSDGATINTADDGELHITTVDGGFIALRPNTTFKIDEYKAEGAGTDKVWMSLLKGSMRSITGWIGKHNTQAYRLTTPTATIGIRGTDHETTVIEESAEDEAGTYDTVNEGATVMETPQGKAEVMPGKHAFAAKNRALAPVFLANHPHFWEKRQLRIEDRILERKSFFRDRMETMRNQRIKNIREHHPEKLDEVLEHRQQMQENKQERREQRLERMEQNRERKENRSENREKLNHRKHEIQ